MIWKKDDLIKIEKYNIIEEENKYYVIELDRDYLLECLTCKAPPNSFSKNDICFFKEGKDAEWKNCSQENFELNEDILEINLCEKYNIQFLRINKIATDIQIFIRKYRGLILACRIDSFACRMFAILNAFYLAELHNVKPGFLWRARNFKTQNIELNMQNEVEMFDGNFIAEYSYYNPNIEQYISKDCCTKGVEIGSVKEFAKPYKYFWGYDCSINVLVVKPFQPNFLKYRDSLRNIWRSIKFIPKYQSIVDELTKKKLDSFVAIHIRNGEAILSDIYKPVIFMDPQIERIFPVEIAIELIKGLLIEKKKVIIFGSDQELLRAIKGFICDEHLYLSTDFTKESLDYFGQVIFDIVLMSKADRIYRPNITMYSELAFIIGECQELLNINQCFTLQEQFEIIYNNLGKYPIGKLHKASSCAYLYKILFEIGKHDFHIADKILRKSFEWDDALIYKLMYLDLLLKNRLWLKAEFFLRQNMNVVKIEELIALIVTLNFVYKGGKKEYLTPNSFCFIVEEFMCGSYHEKYPCLYYLFSKLISKHPAYFDSNKYLKDMVILDEKYIWTLSGQITDIQHSAKSRIHNHLSYKLGQAMIENSKSLLGYIRMPFVLSYIKDKHKQEQKIYQEKIKKDPSLKLPTLESYPDYQESLKEKECLTYKLGEAFIKADKTWYKGGYVRLWFEVRKLKKR